MNRLICIIALLAASFSLNSQTYQEQLKAIRSSLVEQKDGKSYYIHQVKKGQTLYMISKAYDVQVNDIIEANPIVKEGLKADQKLYIPFLVAQQPGQTANDGAKRQTTDGAKRQTNDGAKRQTNDQQPATAAQQPEPATAAQQLPCGSDTSTASKTYKVVLILPLSLDEVAAMDPTTATPESVDNWNPLKYLPFYQGFILAADSMRKKGLHLVLNVYDLGKDSAKTAELLKKKELRGADLIVGLLFHKNFRMLAKFAGEHSIPVVNPISERSEIIRDNPWVFKATPSRSSMMEGLADYLQKSLYRGQIIIIRNGQYKDRDMADRLKKECQERNLNVFLAEAQDVAISRLSKSKENTLVAFTDNSVYALDLMRRFYELRNDYSINLVGLPDWEKLEGLEMDFLNALNTRMVSPYFPDYSSPGVKNLVRRFHLVYKTDPVTLSFQGFDIGFYFLSALMKFGKQFPVCISEYRLQGAQTSFDFPRQSSAQANGFENRHWCVYKYENFRLVKDN